MDKRLVRRTLEIAEQSDNPTVESALERLIEVVRIAHGEEVGEARAEIAKQDAAREIQPALRDYFDVPSPRRDEDRGQHEH